MKPNLRLHISDTEAPEPDRVFEIHISLQWSDPPIWRSIAVPANITLDQLHLIIQVVMDWEDEHLHQFTLNDKPKQKSKKTDSQMKITPAMRTFVPTTTPHGDPLEVEGEDESQFTLAELCPNLKSKITYTYDFGDSWDHIIEVRKITPKTPGVTYPVCLEGELAAPPEDSGGIPGYYFKLDLIAGKVENPQRQGWSRQSIEEIREWFGDFDPHAFDIDAINKQLAQWPHD